MLMDDNGLHATQVCSNCDEVVKKLRVKCNIYVVKLEK